MAEEFQRKTWKDYLGDGLYVVFDGYQYELRANDMEYPTDKVFLEPNVLKNFMGFVERIKAEIKEIQEQGG